MRKFELATKGNCNGGIGHFFLKIRDEGLVSWIRVELPQLTFSLWQCDHCEKVTEGT